MLFFLTGDIQTGKTRWLISLLARMEATGVHLGGVLAPGIWIERANPADASHKVTYEKLGIDNELLPQHERIPFARRRDLAEQDGTYQANSQSGQIQLGWAIDDAAIERVNEHFDMLAAQAQQTAQQNATTPSLLVIDEIGRLELERNTGLTSAVALLDQGATPTYPHALVVMRSALLDTANARFAHAPWNGMQTIQADEAGETVLLAAVGLV